jgi:hypothetical protein
MRQGYEIAEEIASRITLNRVIKTLPEYAPRTLGHWRIDLEKVKAEINALLTEEQRYLMSYDLIEQIDDALYDRLCSRLFADGITD